MWESVLGSDDQRLIKIELTIYELIMTTKGYYFCHLAKI
jgi:hypothetical protein